MPQTPPASTGEEISESKVTWQDQVILFTVLAGGPCDPFMLPPLYRLGGLVTLLPLLTFSPCGLSTTRYFAGVIGLYTIYNLMPEVDIWDFNSHVENPMQRATSFTMLGAA